MPSSFTYGFILEPYFNAAFNLLISDPKSQGKILLLNFSLNTSLNSSSLKPSDNQTSKASSV
jgi:hypothetical protein